MFNNKLIFILVITSMFTLFFSACQPPVGPVIEPAPAPVIEPAPAPVIEPSPEPDPSFISKWRTAQDGEELRLLFWDNKEAVDFTIDWGDGTEKEHYTSATVTIDSYWGTISGVVHSYAKADDYEVTILGSYGLFGSTSSMAPEVFKTKLIDVIQWGKVKLHNAGGQFASCANLTGFSAKDTPDLSRISNISGMFGNSNKFNGDLSGWDTSTITNMKEVFFSAYSFNQNISMWKTSNVTTMEGMFCNATNFNQDISTWETSGVTNMARMFNSTKAFDQDISEWKTAKVTTMSNMFISAQAFTCGGIDISKWIWDVSKLAADVKFTDTPLENTPPAWSIN